MSQIQTQATITTKTKTKTKIYSKALTKKQGSTKTQTVQCAHKQNPEDAPTDLLAKYAVMMAQTHNLLRTLASSTPLTSIALHPHAPLTDASLNGTLIPLLRNQQTTDVLCAESTSVRRLGSVLKLPEDALPHVVLEAVSEATVVLIPLLRNQQTTDVLCAESASMCRLGSTLKLPEDAPPHIVLEAISEATVALILLLYN